MGVQWPHSQVVRCCPVMAAGSLESSWRSVVTFSAPPAVVQERQTGVLQGMGIDGLLGLDRTSKSFVAQVSILRESGRWYG